MTAALASNIVAEPRHENKVDHKLPPEEDVDPKYVYKREIVWRNVAMMTMLHGLAFYGLFAFAFDPEKPWWGGLIVDAMGRLSAIGVTAGSHRLWSHRSYKARLPLRIVLMILQTMALQDDIYQWCRDHRLHHKHSDTNADPYNAQRGFFFSHMGWLMVRKHPEVIAKGNKINLDDLWADPVVRFQRRFYIPLVILLWGVVPTYILHWTTGTSIFVSIVGAVFFRYTASLHHAWTVNSWAHLYGMQPFDKNLEPRENRLVNYLAIGEGLHNYHHTFPTDYSASEFGWERSFNLTTMFIDGCAWLGLAYDRKKINKVTIAARVQRTGNLEHYRFFARLKTVLEYAIGLIVSHFVFISIMSLRYILFGHF